MAVSVPARLRKMWGVLSSFPGGRTVFSFLVGQAAPYSGSIGATVLELQPGYAKVELRDRRRVRNHLNSVHAIALMNLAEMSTGLAMLFSMPDDTRGILKGLSMDYLKKARGRLVAECTCDVLPSNEARELVIEGFIRNTEGVVVARGEARWLVGPRM